MKASPRILKYPQTGIPSRAGTTLQLGCSNTSPVGDNPPLNPGQLPSPQQLQHGETSPKMLAAAMRSACQDWLVFCCGRWHRERRGHCVCFGKLLFKLDVRREMHMLVCLRWREEVCEGCTKSTSGASSPPRETIKASPVETQIKLRKISRWHPSRSSLFSIFGTKQVFP